MTTITSPPAHRPSRRNDIIDAAIALFARKGLTDASINDVAEEANVVATAVYYHFSGKEELYSAAVHKVFDSISEVVSTVRADGVPGDEPTLDAVIDAVWDWIDTHPDEATLLYLQLPGATRQIATLRQEFEELHVQRAFGYLRTGESRNRTTAARRGVEQLCARTLVDMLIAIHTMRLADGPLSNEPSAKLRTALREISHRIVALS
ncbi:MAG TPA: TetR/AcrR family transcriptional regulator [Acidimicrobiales bacterium]|nr:TetR/AcrR family transcriptional regulator [Acidimicrobiales bacterium]